MPSCVLPSLDHYHKVGITFYTINTFSYSFIPCTSNGWNCLPSSIATIIIQLQMTRISCAEHIFRCRQSPLQCLASKVCKKFAVLFLSMDQTVMCRIVFHDECKLQPQPSKHTTHVSNATSSFCTPFSCFGNLHSWQNLLTPPHSPLSCLYCFFCCCSCFLFLRSNCVAGGACGKGVWQRDFTSLHGYLVRYPNHNC